MKRFTTAAPRHRGFSLVEMIIAIFVLGIGVISIAALFPVGLTQQRRSNDAIMGTVVANHAYEVIRSKVSSDDFGWLNFDPNLGSFPEDGYAIVQGDFKWRRPAFYLVDANIQDQYGNSRDISAGSIDLFLGTRDPFGNGMAGADANTVTELPFNGVKHQAATPQIIITQEERYWPQQSTEAILNDSALPQPPQYVWDCMFRRFEGRIQVAIFVYRVHGAGGEGGIYRVNFASQLGADIPPLPHYNVLDGSGPGADDPWHPDFDFNDPPGTVNDVVIPGTDRGDPFDPLTWDLGWQSPGQWILDQNNTIHNVSVGRRSGSAGPVELTRPVPQVPTDPSGFAMPPFSTAQAIGGGPEPTFELWYLPPVVEGFVNGQPVEWTLTPVYVMVREL